MACSKPGLPVHHQLAEFTQTHVHWVGDAIQPSHPLSSPSPPAFNLSQHQGLFKRVSSTHQVGKNWSFSFNISPSNEYSGLISFRIDWLDLLAVQGTLKSLFQHHNSKASILQCSAFFTVQLSHPYMTMDEFHLFTNYLEGKNRHNIFQHTIALTNLGWEWLPESNHSCPFHTYPEAFWISLSLSPLKVYNTAGFEAFCDPEEEKYPDYWIGKQDHTVALWLPYGVLREKFFHFLGNVSD